MKVGSTLSTPRLVKGGSPQGTLLGNYLFTVTIESIEEETGSIASRLPSRIRDRCHRSSLPPPPPKECEIGTAQICDAASGQVP